MATTYAIAEPSAVALLNHALSWHVSLRECNAKFGLLTAHNPDGPAVKHGGYPAAACVRVVPLKDRLTKGYDAEILLDGDYIDGISEARLLAILDHELSHFARVPNKPKAIKRGELPWKMDDLGRPKLRLVKADRNVGDMFLNVIERHGDDAQEFANLRDAWKVAEEAKCDGKKSSEVPSGTLTIDTNDGDKQSPAPRIFHPDGTPPTADRPDEAVTDARSPATGTDDSYE